MHIGRTRGRERGAAAVEMAIILPLLLLVIAGIVDMGRFLFTKVMVTNAAREGVRAAVVTTSTPGPTVRASAAAPGVSGLTVSVVACPSSAAPTNNATVVVRQEPFSWIMLRPAMSMFGAANALPTFVDAKAVMKCGG